MTQNSQYAKKHQKNIRRALLTGSIIGVLAGSYLGKSDNSESSLSSVSCAKVENKITILNQPIRHPLISVSFRNDTLEKTYQGGLLYYKNASITRNFVDGNEKFKLQLYLLVHEWWHSRNDLLKFRSGYLLSPPEFYNLCIYNEISATLASLLVKRYEYLASDDKKSFLNQHKYGYFSFYFNAIAKGLINPEDASSAARDKEWKLIANGMKKTWMDRFADHYSPSFHAMLRFYCNKRAELLWQKHNTHDTYLSLCHKMFDIGGVDFYKYMEEDIDFPDDRVWIAEHVRKIKSLRNGGTKMLELLDSQMELLTQVAPEKQREALQHLLISARLKTLMPKINQKKPEERSRMITLNYQKIFNQLQRDNTFQSVIKNFVSVSPKRCNLLATDADYENVLKEFYNYNDLDLRAFIPQFSTTKVPYETNLKQDLQEYMALNTFVPDDINVSSVLSETNEAPNIILPISYQKTETSVGTSIKRRKPRLSDNLYVTIPDFSKPILLADAETQNKIMESICTFNKIPNVYKNCDTKALQQYQKEHPQETNPFMQKPIINEK